MKGGDEANAARASVLSPDQVVLPC